MVEARKLRIRLESTLDAVEAAELIVQRMADINGFDDDQVHQIGMGVREAVANAVKHGNRFHADKRVLFETSIDAEAFRVVVMDEGGGFDPDGVPDPLSPENLLSGSGRGLMMMRAFFDKVEVGFKAESGAKISLLKYRAEGAGQNP